MFLFFFLSMDPLALKRFSFREKNKLDVLFVDSFKQTTSLFTLTFFKLLLDKGVSEFFHVISITLVDIGRLTPRLKKFSTR